MKPIYSYVPEQNLFDGKDLTKCRIFHDDSAVVNVRDSFRILAQRGFGNCVGKTMLDLLSLTPESHSKLLAFLRSQETVLLLPSDNLSLLFFSDWYSETGLLLVVRLQKSEAFVRKELGFARRSALSPVFCHDKSQFSDHSEGVRSLSEIFYYTERMTDTKTPIPMLLLLSANFAGCKLSHMSLSTGKIYLSLEIHRRLSIFLISLFLTLRAMNGDTSIKAEEALDQPRKNVGKVQVDSHIFSLSVEHGKKEQNPSEALGQAPLVPTDTHFPFLSIPAFSSFAAFSENGVFRFDALLSSLASLHVVGKDKKPQETLSVCIQSIS